VLVHLLKDENAPVDIKNNLLEQQKELSKERPWQSFNLSRQKAKQVLSQAKL